VEDEDDADVSKCVCKDVALFLLAAGDAVTRTLS
jgi:hypothetical protein